MTSDNVRMHQAPPPLAGRDTENNERILRALREHGPMTAGELATELRADVNRVAARTDYMIKTGRLQRARNARGRWRYALPTAGGTRGVAGGPRKRSLSGHSKAGRGNLGGGA